MMAHTVLVSICRFSIRAYLGTIQVTLFWMSSLKFKSWTDFNHHLIVQSSSLDNDIFCLEASFFTIFFNKENWKGIAHHLLTINNNLLHTTTQKDIIYFFTIWNNFVTIFYITVVMIRCRKTPNGSRFLFKICGSRTFVLSQSWDLNCCPYYSIDRYVM